LGQATDGSITAPKECDGIDLRLAWVSYGFLEDVSQAKGVFLFGESRANC